MNDNKDADNDSDVSSNSSWTILDSEQSQSGKHARQNIQQCKGDIAVIVNNPELFLETDLSSRENVYKPDPGELNVESTTGPPDETECEDENDEKCYQHGCLALHEYLNEQELVYDYEFDQKKSTGLENYAKKKDKTKRRKCKAEQVGVLAIIGTVLAVAGFSLLCLMSPNNSTLTRTDIEKLKTELSTTKDNSTISTVPVIYNRAEHKFSVIDKKGVLEKCLCTNSTNVQQNKCLRSNRKFDGLQQFNLIKSDDANNTKELKFYGPITYEEYVKASEERFNAFTNGTKSKVQQLIDKPQQIAKIKNLNILDMSPNASKQSESIKTLNSTYKYNIPHVVNNNNKTIPEKVVLKSLVSRNTAVKSQLQSKRLMEKASQQNLTQVNRDAIDNNTSKLFKTQPQIKEVRNTLTLPIQITKNSATEGNIRPTHNVINPLVQGKIAFDIVQDIMLLRMASQVAKTLNSDDKKGKPSNAKKTSCLKRNSLTELQNPESQEMKNKHPINPSIKYINKTRRLHTRRKRDASITTLKLLDELPFNQRLMPPETDGEKRKIRRRLPKKNNFAVEKKEDEIAVPKISNSTIWLFGPEESKKINGQSKCSMDDFNIKREELLSQLKREEKEREEYIKLTREQGQDAIEAFIQRRPCLGIEKFANAYYKKYQLPISRSYINLNNQFTADNPKLIQHCKLCKEKFKDAGCGNYEVPIPSATEINKKLLELNSKKSLNYCGSFVYNQNFRNSEREDPATTKTNSCCGYAICLCSKRMGNCPTTVYNAKEGLNTKQSLIPRSSLCNGKIYNFNKKVNLPSKREEVVLLNTHSKNNSSHYNERHIKSESINHLVFSEYIEMKRKYYDRIESYWHKRQEYLEQRINFIQHVSNSLHEIMSNYKNNKNNSNDKNVDREAIRNLLKETAAVFPDDAKIQNFKSEINILPESNKSEITETSVPHQDFITEPEETESVKPCEINTSNSNDQLFKFTANPNQLVDCKNCKLNDDTFYKWIFGRKGQQIRKKDLAVWYYNKISKRKNTKDINKREFCTFCRSKKPKKDI